MQHDPEEFAVRTIQFALVGETIALCDLLKATGLAGSGGQAKQLVAGGEVLVDTVTELRKTAKIRAGQRVQCRGACIRVHAPGATPEEGTRS